ncbi:uncharacterized protein LOC113304765 [Papaver somniferum]|uniref:uncharacterized protein LOC113304765 n=1 Tax=Papaver somniferum TaxID=3469 RepID=UPI000E704F95|nr:uncharacterized protein LOC113304765 [Papaver somniferum]
MALQLRSRFRPIQNPNLIKLFSSESNNNGDKVPSSSSSSSLFSDVKESLSSSPPRRNTLNDSPPPPPSSAPKLDEVRKSLSEFRRRSSVPPQPTTSFQHLYKRNVSINSIRESLRNIRKISEKPNARPNNNILSGIDTNSFKSFVKRGSDQETNQSNAALGGGSELPSDIFGGKEIKEKSEAEMEAMKTEFLNPYSHEELGRKLRQLRPDETTKKDFTVHGLNERLKKLRVMEEQVVDKVGGLPLKSLKESLLKLKLDSDEKSRMQMHNISIFGGYWNQYTGPAKELLVEKYFHPDNMSSEEKMKLELKKVRDEFKISESDCGSSHVQVAQLTTKIKHLSSVLHKKDKHSRKGLVAMVQRRKKILRYLRRTDWDSYCQVLSQLGLRDNPDYKH